MANVTSMYDIAKLSLEPGENTITVTSEAASNAYRLTESSESKSISISAGDCDFKLNSDGTYSVCGRGTMVSANLVIPSTHLGEPVTGIDSQAFYNDTTLKSITIPTSIRKIGTSAFRKSGLTNVIFEDIDHMVVFFVNPGWVTPHVYYTYANGQNVWPGEAMNLVSASSNIYSCTVPLDIRSISFNSGNDKFTTQTYEVEGMNLSNALFRPVASTSNGGTDYEMSFNESYDPGTSFLEHGGLSIGNDAFRECEGLTEVSLPRRTVVVGASTFRNCTNLTSVSNPPHNRLLRINEYSFYNCTSLTSARIEDGITDIRENAFDGCSALGGFYFGSKLQKIGTRAFYDCVSLQVIKIPASVIFIGPGAFGLSDLVLSEQGNYSRYIAFEDAYTWFTSSDNIPGAAEMTLMGPGYLYSNPNGGTTTDINRLNGNRLTLTHTGYYWHKLKKMLPPTISLSGNTLTMTDPLGVAEKFYIYVGGKDKPRITVDVTA